MQPTVFYLSTCSTCKKILEQLRPGTGIRRQDIKMEAISPGQLKDMAAMAGSYEALFSRRSRKWKEWRLQEKSLSEDDFRDLILREYTFLKRPVLILKDDIFIGSSKQTIAALKQALRGSS